MPANTPGGQNAACDWLLGRSSICPGSGWNWYTGQRPDRAIIAAEAEINTGEIYLDPTSPPERSTEEASTKYCRIVARFN